MFFSNSKFYYSIAHNVFFSHLCIDIRKRSLSVGKRVYVNRIQNRITYNCFVVYNPKYTIGFNLMSCVCVKLNEL